MVELVMRKRAAMHAGEIGLFIDSQVFEEEFGHIRTGTDISVKATHGHNLKQFRLAWALAARIAQSGVLGDADQREAMDYLLLKCKHVRYISHKYPSGLEETIPVPKSIRWQALDGIDFNRLFNRMIYVIVSQIIPDIPEGELRAKIEEMAGINTPEQEPPKRRRRQPALPAPVSIIPADEPVTAAVPSGPVSEGRSSDTGTIPDPAGQPVTSEVETQPPPPTEPAPSVASQAGQVPTNLATWRESAIAWIALYRADPEKTDQDLTARWISERSLRNKCGVTDVDRQPVFEVYAAAVEEKQKRHKPI